MEGKRTWIYCRVAHADAFALAFQQKGLETYAEKHGLEVIGVTAEYASGLDNSRRGLCEVFQAVDTGTVDFLLVASLTRLGRDVMAMNVCLRWLEDRLVDVICADGMVPQTQTEIMLDLMKASRQ